MAPLPNGCKTNISQLIRNIFTEMQLLSQTENKCMMSPKYLRGNLDTYVIFCPFPSDRTVSKEQEYMFTPMSITLNIAFHSLSFSGRSSQTFTHNSD